MTEWIKLIPGLILLIAGLLYIGRALEAQVHTLDKTVEIFAELKVPEVDDIAHILEEAKQVSIQKLDVPPYVAADDPKPQPPGKEPPRNLVVPHFASWCSVCKTDKAVVFPKWLKVGWSIADPLDETRRPLRNTYPWYEIYDENGKVTTHLGSLSTFKKK
jgi:hypothetical protein